MLLRTQVPSHTRAHVCMSVAVCRTHVELQGRIHTCVCRYVHTDILKGLVRFLQSTVPCLQQENIFNIYTWNRLNHQSNTTDGQATALWFQLVRFITVTLGTNMRSLLLLLCCITLFRAISTAPQISPGSFSVQWLWNANFGCNCSYLFLDVTIFQLDVTVSTM